MGCCCVRLERNRGWMGRLSTGVTGGEIGDSMKILRNSQAGLLVAAAVALGCMGVMAQQQTPATQPAQASQGQSSPAQRGEPKLKGESETAQSDQKIAVEVKVVNILASVRDKKGKTIGDLTKDDFVLTEDGKPQAIAYFAKESDLPLPVWT